MEIAPLDIDVIDTMPYQALRAECKLRGLPAREKSGVLRSSLKQYQAEQQIKQVAPEAAERSVDKQTTALLQPATSDAQEKQSVAVPLSSQHLSGLGSEQQPALEDTAGSSEHSPQATQCYSKFAAADATPLPADSHDMGATSSGQSLHNFQGETANGGKEYQLPATTDGEAVTDHVQGKGPNVSGIQQSLRQLPTWFWLLLLSSLPLICWFASKQQGGKDGSFQGPKCNQLMPFESLAPMLAHAHMRSHMAEVWSGEIRDPHKAGGVLLACPDSNVSSAASAALVSSLSPGCGHCLQHFTMPQLAAMNRAGQGSDLAGQAQKSLVKTLQGCSHAVVIVEGIEAMPSALLPVFINALSEHGHFEHDGKQVPAWNALVVATIVMPTGDLQQVPEEKIESVVKQHMVHKLTDDVHTSGAVTHAAALRRRFEHVALLW